ncbi:hypothetical protein C2845_PM08G28920 [Panicum miliaceum]|uniref:Uncharacterized protein n=1 Tax=Panicum miliaceum TaxID=4540 RepID=A0A3L6R3Z8_PANMI|nr:hypothetical protein C2845_PM08G28920 [Panicum miliaceum]
MLCLVPVRRSHSESTVHILCARCRAHGEEARTAAKSLKSQQGSQSLFLPRNLAPLLYCCSSSPPHSRLLPLLHTAAALLPYPAALSLSASPFQRRPFRSLATPNLAPSRASLSGELSSPTAGSTPPVSASPLLAHGRSDAAACRAPRLLARGGPGGGRRSPPAACPAPRLLARGWPSGGRRSPARGRSGQVARAAGQAASLLPARGQNGVVAPRPRPARPGAAYPPPALRPMLAPEAELRAARSPAWPSSSGGCCMRP